MGGMGFIESNKALCMLSVLVNTHMLMAARAAGVERFFYSSSACVYAAKHQTDPDVTALQEEDAYPAMPEDGYGWEKLFSERMCRHFREDFGLRHPGRPVSQRVWPQRHLRRRAREGAGRDLPQSGRSASSPATTGSRSGATASRPESFMYIDDCVHGHAGALRFRRHRADQSRELRARHHQPARRHRRGHRGRRTRRSTSWTLRRVCAGGIRDNTRILELLGWEPSISLREGLEQTYRWVHDRMAAGERSMMVP